MKMAEFPTFKGSWPWPWPWIGSYCIPSCITHRRLPTHQISSLSKKRFVNGRTGGHLRPTLLGRLAGVNLTSHWNGACLFSWTKYCTFLFSSTETKLITTVNIHLMFLDVFTIDCNRTFASSLHLVIGSWLRDGRFQWRCSGRLTTVKHSERQHELHWQRIKSENCLWKFLFATHPS